MSVQLLVDRLQSDWERAPVKMRKPWAAKEVEACQIVSKASDFSGAFATAVLHVRELLQELR